MTNTELIHRNICQFIKTAYNENDQRMLLLINGAKGYAERYTNRYIGRIVKVKERIRVNNNGVAFLKNVDIQDDFTLIDRHNDESRYVDKENGIVKFYNIRNATLEVSYSCGESNISDDLMLAFVCYCGNEYLSRNTTENSSVQSESVGGYSVSYGANNSLESVTRSRREGVSNNLAVFNMYLDNYRVTRNAERLF